MRTVTARNVLARVVRSLKARGKRHPRAKEQAAGELFDGYATERRAVLDQIEASWQAQTRRPTAADVDAWIAVGQR